MEQRPLRLGDIVDDYCPRERRITNHAIVALVGDAIRQTRCTTCDAEHVYKEAKVPRRKKPDALYDQVLAEASPAQLVPLKDDVDLPALAAAATGSDDPAVSKPPDPDRPVADTASTGDPEPPQPETRTEDLWAAHRPLIRATLPRTENDPPTPRPIPEFTMHQRRTRGGQMFRQGGWQGQGNGNVRHNGFRHGRSAQGHGQGHGQHHGNGPGPNRHDSGGRSGRRHGSKNKRSR
jgi:hypothetical protein